MTSIDFILDNAINTYSTAMRLTGGMYHGHFYYKPSVGFHRGDCIFVMDGVDVPPGYKLADARNVRGNFTRDQVVKYVSEFLRTLPVLEAE